MNSILCSIWRVISVVLNLIFIGCFSMGMLLVFIAFSGWGKLLIVQSGSMEPALPVGSLIVSRAANEYRVGDIVTFKKNNGSFESITHRIVDIEEELGSPLYITRGDANNGADREKVKLEDIVGRVIFDLPGVGYAISIFHKPIIFLVVIVVPALWLVGGEVISIRKELKKRKINATNIDVQ